MNQYTEEKNGYTLTIKLDKSNEYVWYVHHGEDCIDLGANKLYEESLADGKATLEEVAA